jgi:hypothetical protein
MDKRNYMFGVFITAVFLTSCNNNPVSLKPGEKEDKQTITNIDSTELTTLVKNVYEWHLKKRSNDFPYKFSNPSDSIFIGIDWAAYARNIDDLKKTNFFSNEFFINHRSIALSIDSSMKQANVEWRNINDGIPIWDTDADDWCGCQDYPDNYWKTITLSEFSLQNDTLTFYWTWGNENGIQANKYELKANKENGTWKISYMEGFKYYGKVADYKKIMQK